MTETKVANNKREQNIVLSEEKWRWPPLEEFATGNLFEQVSSFHNHIRTTYGMREEAQQLMGKSIFIPNGERSAVALSWYLDGVSQKRIVNRIYRMIVHNK